MTRMDESREMNESRELNRSTKMSDEIGAPSQLIDSVYALMESVKLRELDLAERENALMKGKAGEPGEKLWGVPGFYKKSKLFRKSLESRLNAKEEEILNKETALLKRLEEVTRREEKAAEAERIRDAGYTESRRQFSDQMDSMRREFEEWRQNRIRETDDEFKRYRDEQRIRLDTALETERASRISSMDAEFNLRRREMETDIERRRKEADDEISRNRDESDCELHRKLKELEAKISHGYEELEAEITHKRAELELEITHKHMELDSEITRKRRELDSEIIYRRGELDSEITRIREELEAELTRRRGESEAEIARKYEAFNIEKAKLDAETTRRYKDLETESSRRHKELDNLAKSLGSEKTHMDSMEASIRQRISELDTREILIKAEKEQLDISVKEMEKTIHRKIEERKRSFEAETAANEREMDRLRESIRRSSETLGLFDELKRKLGDEEPETILRQMSDKEVALNQLRTDLAQRPGREVQAAFEETNKARQIAEDELERVTNEKLQLEKRFLQTTQLEIKNQRLEDEKNSLSERNELLTLRIKQNEEELNRLKPVYEDPAEADARIASIMKPAFDEHPPKIRKGDILETEWLAGIEKEIKRHGYSFPRRILYAFHTSLKTAEMSPLTILAGVSGTGKSQLPKLYSHFGGMQFMPVSVQPNWDSQESMLGFFNSIDNKFDAQPVLRFLLQSQQEATDDYPGLNAAMNMVLLDEMNLAHVELYFAEFLSQLEMRRAHNRNEVPELAVKMGAGAKAYPLPLGHNVLWVGTMNQDETTKSLSDKVLDRGTIIYFPRPTELVRLSGMKSLSKQSALLPKAVWESWVRRPDILATLYEKTKKYKDIAEDINNHLGIAGRALGHRVWQTIESYLSNYPDVIAALNKECSAIANEEALGVALKTAFEDQLVQKIMPKLRGIDIEGAHSECLKRIRDKLSNEGFENLIPDFDKSSDPVNGQFIWNSANYLKDSQTTVEDENIVPDEERKRANRFDTVKIQEKADAVEKEIEDTRTAEDEYKTDQKDDDKTEADEKYDDEEENNKYDKEDADDGVEDGNDLNEDENDGDDEEDGDDDEEDELDDYDYKDE